MAESTSHTIPEPPPLKVKPKLSDFSYLGTHFPDTAPSIKPEENPNPSSLEITISLISTILGSTKNDLAIAYLLDHKIVNRLFKPRQLVTIGGGFKDADYELDEQRKARAMAWFVFDAGVPTTPCPTCLNEQSKGPFGDCVIPIDEDAEGACTNCFFMGRAALCAHRNAAKTPQKRSLEQSNGSVLTARDIKAATTQNLGRWWGRVQGELDKREAPAPEVKTPRGPKRPKVD